ncbi:hypothetical protein PXK30_02760 [Phaeobacter gallaeciensis]|uniref:hypothetical protein n=1 Tax=Phaeobacter gallaeciensis TaxID=60890 RepID=UPI00237F20DF|nr:hypothetical protein [Phaeobacter gallaeciensis]MDE4303831.1 hypothetical protein [Phaeobacter gallaeciensis]MDE4308890.1 hypothetical protein [Phaeobacter gallaeciensis]MDE4313556.1 hypothetical protein [Phaeobacter gallaeciensis]MDE4317819.1 hypothetical protein [Phaeobacter gallaeciensis]MDE4322282.1 hypothetical protein [Phaeobacter gallaeciensis]
MTDLTLFHTADVHVATFDALAPEADLTHVVRTDWLERAQTGVDDDLRQEIAEAIHAAKGPALCTCTTIGAVAEEAGATRIDWPMMQQAAGTGGPVMLVYCLDSTRLPSTALLERAFAKQGRAPDIRALPLPGLWHHFTNGDTEEFHKQVATWVSTSLTLTPGTACVVLAQASMAGAAALIDSDIPVLTSPDTAMAALLGQG